MKRTGENFYSIPLVTISPIFGSGGRGISYQSHRTSGFLSSYHIPRLSLQSLCLGIGGEPPLSTGHYAGVIPPPHQPLPAQGCHCGCGIELGGQAWLSGLLFHGAAQREQICTSIYNMSNIACIMHYTVCYK